MKNFYSIKALLLVCLLVTFGFLQSCDDDEEAGSSKVELLSFGPTGVKHGETIRFIGHNLNQVESIQLAGALVTKAEFTSQSSELIELVVPENAAQGRVVLKTTNGEEISSKSVLSFEVPVVITSVTGEAKPGTNITIKGDFLNWVEGVQFGSLEPVTSFVSQTKAELVVTVPMEAKTGLLTIFTGGTKPLVLETEEVLTVFLPMVTGFSPSALKHGENLTITGTNLDLVKEIRFTAVGDAKVTKANFVSQSESQIVVELPKNVSSGAITLVALSDVEVPTTQTVSVVLPAITNLAPSPIDHGANLTITGTNLDLVKSVVFGGGTEVSSFVSQSPTRIVVKTPEGAMKGIITLVTTNDYVVATDKVLEFTGGLPPLAPLPYALYDDALKSGWGDWGYGGATVWNSMEMVRQGNYAIKKTYNGNWDVVRMHTDAAVSTSGYTEITFSIFGTPGSGGKVINLILNAGWDSGYPITVVEGEWTTYNVRLSDPKFNSPATINDVLFQAAGWAGVVYIDHIGFK